MALTVGGDGLRLQLDPQVNPAQANPANEAHQTAAAFRSGGAGAAGNSGSDRIQISGTASLVAASASERSARVDQLKAAVQNGTYQPDSTLTSRAIVSGSLP
jgi:anti-sigma28 factor (negative regulator of flagellin synthesis)